MASQGISTPKLGDVVAGRYELTGELGKGGFGMVFKATQIGMNRPVALKVLLPQAASVNTVVERFQREAQLAKNLVHPNTIQLFDFGETDSGCLFIAMEYLEGQTLEDLVKREGPLPMDRVVYIASQILKSLAEAHEHGIVHRDLKPANIFMRELVGEKDFVKVLDFGIAKALNIDGAEEKQLTQTGSAFGTPSYMPPEQIKGAEMGPYTDLYALGLIMLKMLTGRTAIEGGTPIETAALQLSPSAIPLPEPIARSPLAHVISKVLSKRFQERYQTALEMLRDLQQVQAQLRSGVMPALTGPLPYPQGHSPQSGIHYTGGGDVSMGLINDSGLSGPMPLPISAQPKRSNKWIVVAAIIMGIAIGAVAYIFIFNKPSQSNPAEASEKNPSKPDPAPTEPPTQQASLPPATTPPPIPDPPKPAPEPEVTQIAFQSDPDGAFVYDVTELTDLSDIEKGKHLGVTTLKHTFDGKSGTRKVAIYKIGFEPHIADIDLASPKPIAVQLKRPPAPIPDPALANNNPLPPTNPPPTDTPPATDDPSKTPEVAADNPDKTDKKPDDTKPSDKKPSDRKKPKDKDGTSAKKPDDKKPDDTKPADKPDDKKPDDKKPTTTITLPD